MSSRNFHENKKKSTKRNPIAKALKNPSLKQQVVPSKKRKYEEEFRKAEAMDLERRNK